MRHIFIRAPLAGAAILLSAAAVSAAPNPPIDYSPECDHYFSERSQPSEVTATCDKWGSGLTTTVAAPAERNFHTIVWTGSKLIVWGGQNVGGHLNTGGQYDPITNSWSATTTTNAPSVRRFHMPAAIWTGTKMVVWGGFDGTNYLNTGGQYDPSGDSWSATSTASAPAGRYVQGTTWTGSKMIIWGGANAAYLNTGGQYDPSGNSWSATATAGAPTGRFYHSTVWTGSKMIVWGGQDGSNHYNTGGQYDPSGNSWSATSTSGAPAMRGSHIGVWSGSELIVWGGHDGTNFLNTGGKYDPSTDTWRATTTAGAPTPRNVPGGDWMGSKMVVWAGFDGTNYLNTGGVYYPYKDAWSATTTTGAPSGRRSDYNAVAVPAFGGNQLLVWGGANGSVFFNTGGLYFP